MVLVAVGQHLGLTGPLRVFNTANQARLPAKAIERDGFAIRDNSAVDKNIIGLGVEDDRNPLRMIINGLLISWVSEILAPYPRC